MNPLHSPEKLWLLSLQQLRELLLTPDGVGEEVKTRALDLIIAREVETAYPERSVGSRTPCFVCGKPTNSLAANPGQWGMHFAHVGAPGKHRCYHLGCLYPILLNTEVKTLENNKLRSALNDLMVPYRDACKGGLPSGVYVQRFRFEDAEKVLA